MVKLVARTPLDDLVFDHGDTRLAEVDLGPLTCLSARRDVGALGSALEAAHGVVWPAPGATAVSGETRIIWFGVGQAMLKGVSPAGGLAEHAALVDQSDAWAAMELSGAGARTVLARLTPIDLRDGAFAEGRTARTLLQHMGCSLTRTGPDTYLILVMRSMAGSAAHDLTRAMETVAARATI